MSYLKAESSDVLIVQSYCYEQIIAQFSKSGLMPESDWVS